MLLVKTRIGPSTIHGIGLFADVAIPAGTKTWEYVSWFDTTYTPEQISQMSAPAREQILWYAYVEAASGNYILCADDQRFINHSSDPSQINIKSSVDADVALRDIAAGEELICNYNDFDPTYISRLGKAEMH